MVIASLLNKCNLSYYIKTIHHYFLYSFRIKTLKSLIFKVINTNFIDSISFTKGCDIGNYSFYIYISRNN